MVSPHLSPLIVWVLIFNPKDPVTGLAAAGTCLENLNRTLEILERAKNAWDRTKNGIAYLDKVYTDVNATISVIKVIELAPEVKVDPVAVAVSQLASSATRLEKVISDLDKESKADKSKFLKFVKHFIAGNHEQSMMEEMRKDLNDGKSTLILALVTAQVGITKTSGSGDVIINVVVVNRVNELFRQCPGLEEGLRIAKLLKARGKKESDGWHLLDQDLAELASPPPYSAYPPYPPAEGKRTRQFVDKNKSDLGGLVMGGGIGKDGGDFDSVYHPDDLYVRGNEATRGGMVLGGGTSARIFMALRRDMAQNPYPDQPSQLQNSSQKQTDKVKGDTGCTCGQELCECK